MGAVAVLILAAAFAIRLAYVDATPGMKLVADGRDYDGHAVSIAQGNGYSASYALRPTAFRPPGFTYLLGGVYWAAGVERAAAPERIIVARRAQIVIGTVLVATIGLVGALLWGPVVALVAMALAAVYVPLVTMSGTVMSEPLFAIFMLGCLAAAIMHRRSAHRWRWALLAGALAGLAILTRANALILLLPLALVAWDGRPRWSLRALGPPVALVAVAVLVVSPWTIRNAADAAPLRAGLDAARLGAGGHVQRRRANGQEAPGVVALAAPRRLLPGPRRRPRAHGRGRAREATARPRGALRRSTTRRTSRSSRSGRRYAPSTSAASTGRSTRRGP